MEAERDIPISGDCETPSRYELLTMVRNHSNHLVERTDDEQETSDVEMDAEFWHEMLDLYFIRCRVTQGCKEDDLVFFIRNMSLHEYGFNDNMEDEPPFFVRRWAHKVLSDTDHCFCVLLNANGGAAFPEENIDIDSYSPRRIDSDFDRSKILKLTLFSGFVSYPMVREAFDAGKSRFGGLLSSHVSSKADKLYMRGPGGRGEVEVAVSGIADQSRRDFGPHSPIQISKRGLGIDLGTIVHKACVFAKNAYAAASSSRKSDAELLPLKCCLVSISLPWEHIAHDLLFKAYSVF